MILSTYEPSSLEIKLTLSFGLTVLSPYYRSFVRSLDIEGDERVLDFGSGAGICSRHVAARLQNGGQLACVDVSERWIEVIRHTLSRYDNVSYHCGHITRIDLPDNHIDRVLIHFVIHDVPTEERQVVISGLVKKLKPGGRINIREPQGEGLDIEELTQLTAAAGLSTLKLKQNKTAIGSVIDGCFIRKEEKK